MNLRQLEVFHAIMVTGSITGAARLLNVTQPAVSTVLKHCETQMKMKLFVRVAGRLQPTAEAEAVFPEVASIFGRLDAVSRLTQDLVGGRLGTLSIAAAFPIANGYLAKAVASFVSSRPNLRATLQSLTSPQVLDRVINREAELGVAHEPIISSLVETEVLVKTGISCVMPPDHPLAARDEVDIRDLVDYPLITYLPHIQWRPFIDRALSEAGIAPRISVQVSLSITGIMLARFGAGVALAEPLLVASLKLPGVTVRPLRPRIEAKTFLLRLKSAPQSPAIDAFIDHLKETIRTDLSHQFYL
jgi:DNA-binding transcriptional LysR family regulator